MASSPLFPERLRHPRFIEGKAKQVDHALGFTDRTGQVKGNAALRDDLHRIIYAIGKGNRLPERCYRRAIDRNDDEMLQTYGINHVHLGKAGSDVLLFYVEYNDFVLLLEIDRHRDHFKPPVAEVLNRLHNTGLQLADDKAQALKSARNAALRRLLFQKKPR
jgi:hypothetical protein